MSQPTTRLVRFQTMAELIGELSPSNEVMRLWLARHRGCITGRNYDALTGCLTHVPGPTTKDEIAAIIRENPQP